jgi:hypothetical protein
MAKPVPEGVFLLGGSKVFGTQVMWFKRDHRLNLLGLSQSLFDEVKGTRWWGTATLVREPDNEADGNAVLVYLRDLPVGYLPSDEAERLSDWLDDRAAEGVTVWCPCTVTIEMGLAEVCVDLY